MIEFVWPYMFFLLPLPWLIYSCLPASQRQDDAALRVPDWTDFDHTQLPSSRSLLKWRVGLAFLVWSALLTAAARPQWIGQPIEIPQSGRDLMMAIDLSGSMKLQDFEINGQPVDRLSALKWIAGDFIDRRQGDRIGLILFGSRAYLHTPLTFDLASVKQLLSEATVGIAGNETAIGDAIGLAVKHLRDSPHTSRVLILLTDGVNNVGALSPERAAEIAAHAHLKVHTVAIGSSDMMVPTPFGPRKVHVSADIDEKALKMVAEKTGGEYFRAYNTSELVQIYQHIDALEVTEKSNQYYRPHDEVYYYPLSIALAFMGVLMGAEFLGRRNR